MKKFKIILFLFLISLTLVKANDNYYFEQISPESGFAFDAVYAISEDCNGFVWFGCNNGLYYYNTSSINKINLLPIHQNNSQSLRITDLYHDFECRLWVCSEEGLFLRNSLDNNFQKMELYSNDSTINTNSAISRILQFNEQFYLIVINGTLFFFDKEEQVLHETKFEGFETTGTISYLGLDQQKNILVASNQGKVFIGRQPNDQFTLFYDSGSDIIRTICDDNNKYYIGFNSKGIEVVNTIGNKISEMNTALTQNNYLPDNRVRDIIKTDAGKIWIGTYQGIVVLENEKNTLITNTGKNGLPHKSIYVLHKSKNNGIWLGTWAGGIAYYKEENYRFNHIVKVPTEPESKSVISAFAEEKNGNIWVGSEQGGINIFNIASGEFLHDNKLSQFENLSRIKSLRTVNKENIIIGTFYQGIWNYNQTENKLYKISENFLNDAAIISTIAGVENELFVGMRGAGNSFIKYDLITKKIESFDIFSNDKNSRGYLRTWKILIDSSHKVWIATDEGLYYANKNENIFHDCFKDDTIFGLSQTMIYTLYEDKNEILWIGTKGMGLFKYSLSNAQLSRISDDQVIASADIFGITEDKNGDIWFSTDKGIFCFNQTNQKTTSYSTFDGLPGDQFMPNSVLASSSGEIFFGSSNGFCYINPENIKLNTVTPDIFLSQLLINNKPINQSKKFEANSYIVEDIKDIKLRHDQNSLTFSVVANNFIKPEKNKFKYRLTNYEEDWIEVAFHKDITFTKIPPGKYTLEVLGSNNDNVWSNTPLKVNIEILHPIWQKWYALLVYFFILATITYLIIKEIDLRLKLRKEILAERFKSEAKEIVFSEKLKFFTNISHEIRTPLTLIISPLNNLLQKFQFDKITSEQLLSIKRNSQRLLRLTNQILDFRLLEVNKLKPHYQNSDIVAICTEVFSCFELWIKEKQINFIFSSNFKNLWVNIDPDMIEKIVYNLVSNAIKFSNERGQIFLTIESRELTEEDYRGYVNSGNLFKGKSVEIKVKDFGKGIKKEFLPVVLERFSTDPDELATGAGIGLHLCQEYAKLHNGNILVESEEGVGSTFILNIPFQENSQYEKKSVVKQLSFESIAEPDTTQSDKNYPVGQKKVVLIAEDNDELRNYLKQYFSRYYKIITAKNGQQAVEIAKEVIPDMIITDILMPQLNGIQLTEALKNNIATSQIPIIVLTALSESKYQKESLSKGADSYLIKPVDETVLLAQIENILSKREMIKKSLEHADQLHNEPETKYIGNSIIENAEKIIELHLRNTDFDLTKLLETLNVSRSTFHRKIKAYADQSPSEFIRDIRLKNAVELMKSGKFNIDEIGTYVGFNSTSYFIRSFKKKYGKTPKEYYTGLAGIKQD
jgi:signal transduction histidine kinase/ligand-binding sensor domain-containing protein/DNA-binding response OmpR family regulator